MHHFGQSLEIIIIIQHLHSAEYLTAILCTQTELTHANTIVL